MACEHFQGDPLSETCRLLWAALTSSQCQSLAKTRGGKAPPRDTLTDDKSHFLVLFAEEALVSTRKQREEALWGPRDATGPHPLSPGLTAGGARALGRRVTPHWSLALLGTGAHRRHWPWGLPGEGAHRRKGETALSTAVTLLAQPQGWDSTSRNLAFLRESAQHSCPGRR